MAMTTGVAWSESAAKNGLVEVAAVPDAQHVPTSGDNVTVPPWASQLVGVMVIGAAAARAQLRSPSLRTRWGNFEIRPLDAGAEPEGTAFRHMLHPWAPLPLDPGEDVQAFVDNANTAGRDTVLAWLADGPVAPDNRPFFTVRATGTTTLTAGVWGNVPLTFDETIPKGEWDIIGARVESAGALAGRIVTPGQFHRPMVPGSDGANDSDANAFFRAGRMGVLGKLRARSLPSVDVLSVSADAAQTVWLDLAMPMQGRAVA